jgi:hypothetical protein
MGGHLYVATDLRSSRLPLPLDSPPAALWVRFYSDGGVDGADGSGVAGRGGGSGGVPDDVLCYLLTPALYATLVRQVSALTLASLPPDKRAAALARWEVIEEWAVRCGWQPPRDEDDVPDQRLAEAPVPLWLLDDLERAV